MDEKKIADVKFSNLENLGGGGGKDEVIQLRVTQEEKAAIERNARAADLNVSEFIRFCTITYYEIWNKRRQ